MWSFEIHFQYIWNFFRIYLNDGILSIVSIETSRYWRNKNRDYRDSRFKDSDIDNHTLFSYIRSNVWNQYQQIMFLLFSSIMITCPLKICFMKWFIWENGFAEPKTCTQTFAHNEYMDIYLCIMSFECVCDDMPVLVLVSPICSIPPTSVWMQHASFIWICC